MPRSCIAIALSLLAAGASAQNLGFRVTNSTGFPIAELAISPPNLSYWGRNVLGPPAIKVGETRNVVVRPDGTECIQDIKVVFSNDASLAVWQNLNLCNLRHITLFFDRMSGITTAKYE